MLSKNVLPGRLNAQPSTASRACRPVTVCRSLPVKEGSLQWSFPAVTSLMSLSYLVPSSAIADVIENVPDVVQKASSKGNWVQPVSDGLEFVLYAIQGQLDKLHLSNSYGLSIIILTLLVKIATFPLAKKQVESAMAVQALKPRIDLIKQRYGEDKDKIQKETSILYEAAGVNPLAGCLPSLATLPIFIGLYTSLTNVANAGSLEDQGFFWIPSLAGPTSMANRQAGTGTSWLFPFVDGAPPIGWHDALLYLSLPALLLVAQYASSAVTSAPIDPKDPNANTQKAMYVVLPLMLVYFSLNVPAGLSLYYLSNTVLTTAQQIYLRQFGGAEVKMNDLGPVTRPGSGRRTGAPVTDMEWWTPPSVLAAKAAEAGEAAAEDNVDHSFTDANSDADGNMPVVPIDPASVNRRCKRRRLSTMQVAA